MAESVLCACGCGLPTPLAPRTNRSKGWIGGQPLRFLRFHHLSGIAQNRPVVLAYRARAIKPRSCACGCGQATSKSKGSRGVQSGDYHRFAPGHHKRLVPTKGYALKKMRDGSIMALHRIRAENALGRSLPLGAEVHHADGSKSVTAPLVICQDHAYHMLLHRRMRERDRARASA